MEFTPKSMLQGVNAIATTAAILVMDYYHSEFEVTYKEDESPLTSADVAAHNYITSELNKKWPSIPIVSEEGDIASYDVRKEWDYFWLVDPIDGTKEFSKREDEFTINIALIRGTEVVLGVVVAPALDKHYYSAEGVGSVLLDSKGEHFLKPPQVIDGKPSEVSGLITLLSKSHREPEIDDYIAHLANVSPLTVGSSLKFCTVAEGTADLYPRMAPLKEWDIAAGHAVVKFAGRNVYQMNTRDEHHYNSATLTVTPFEAY
ncbi:MAG: 3'(2'),5'-bisphosphate nucleotidase CysQ [Fibrobacterales bacterium]